MDADTMFVRSLGCQFLPRDYHPGLDVSLRPVPYCGSHDLEGESVYCRHHFPMIYDVAGVRGKKAAKRKSKKSV